MNTPLLYRLNIMCREMIAVGVFMVMSVSTLSAEGLPGTTAHELAEGANKVLTQLMSEGPCPCDSKITLLQCIQAKSCPDATALAEFGVTKFKEGLGREQVIEAVINKYVEDFVPPFRFQLDSTASKGPENASITIVEFADFECPHCALMSGIIKDLMKLYPTKIRVYFKQFPLPFHPLAAQASVATLAAHQQGAFWPMHDLVFAHQTALKPESFSQFAEQIGIDVQRFNTDMANPLFKDIVEKDKQEGLQAGLSGTPTLFFNGKRYTGDPTFDALKSHIDALIKTMKGQVTPKETPSPSKIAPIKPPSVRTAPVKTAPVKTAPVKTAPVKTVTPQ